MPPLSLLTMRKKRQSPTASGPRLANVLCIFLANRFAARQLRLDPPFGSPMSTSSSASFPPAATCSGTNGPGTRPLQVLPAESRHQGFTLPRDCGGHSAPAGESPSPREASERLKGG